MKLYKDVITVEDGRTIHTPFSAKEATLSDIRQAAKEFECVVISLTDLKDLCDSFGVRVANKIKAAEAADD